MNDLDKENIAKELLSIVRERTLSCSSINRLEIRSHHRTNFLHFEFEKKTQNPKEYYAFMVSSETTIFEMQGNELDDNVLIIDCYYKEGYLNFDNHFNIFGKETILQFFQRVYDEITETYTFAYGDKAIFKQRPQTMDDIITCIQYDGNNYCYCLNVLEDLDNKHFEMKMYPVINVRERTIFPYFDITSNGFEYDDYEYCLKDIRKTIILDHLGKGEADLLPSDSTVLQMLNI
jgi:hypothetical protein